MRNYGWVCVAALLAVTACDTKETVVEQDFGFDGTCVRCHSGLSSGQVHPTFKLRCIDCHGGNDQVEEVPEDAFENEADFRDPDLIGASHVAIKADLARFFFANGLDDDGDGEIDEAIDFDNTANPTQVEDFGEIAELGLQGEGVGEFVDSELNRDLNYTRWLNPGDLRVATIGCGSRSRPALDGEAGGACHQDVVEINRRSIMVNNAAVINGAYYGNESWRDTFQDARDNPSEAADPRKGAFGYTLDFGGIDGCIDISAAGDDSGRGQAVFDSDCLEGVSTDNDPFAAANATGNQGLPAFEAAQGKLVGSAPGTPAEATFFYTGVGGLSRFEWGGFTVADPAAILDEIEAMPDEDILAGVPDPIDNVLRGFRAYYPMNYPGSASNFQFTFGTSILPEIAQFNTFNPFGRGHSSGCTSCHMKYDYTGNRRPQKVETYDPDTGEKLVEEVRDPTTAHREFNAEEDIKRIGGETLLVGVAVNRAERVRAVLGEPAVAPSEAQEEDALEDQPQQRYYSADHTIDTKITTDQCGLCHAFVTRIDFAYQGMAEDEQRDKLARIAAIEFETPAGTSVAIHDSWVRAEALDLGNLADKTVIVPQPGVDVAGAARNRDLEIEEETRERCGDRGVILPGAGGCAQNVFTEDCNNNGELDTRLTLTRIAEDGSELCSITINEDDLESNGVLDLISHVPRERSVDGRQLRYVYGGANGSTRLMDIHFERGMHCIDCHMLQDSHGDGNIYATNWEQIEIECEDCHGAALSDGTLVKATLVTSGANGGNDLRGAIDHDGRPFFEDQGDRIIQRSRVTPGLFWEIPQVPDIVNPDSKFFNPVAQEAHAPQHIPVQADPLGFTQGSEFAGDPGQSELTRASLECYTCHTSWVKNCLGCHFNQNLGDDVKKLVNADGSIVNVAGENEVWFNNKNQAARTNFQLLSLMRSPFVLGYNASADGHRLSWFRSSMEAHLTVFDTNGDTLLDNVTFTTFQAQDANSGRDNVATSAVAMNQHMPHTVRPAETKSCDQCHQLVDEQGRVRNDHILAETYGIGTGRYAYTGDWAIAAGQPLAGDSGLELYDYKQDNQLAGSNGANARFPGIIINPAAVDRQLANVEPLFDGTQGGVNNTFAGTDVALIRNFNPSPAAAGQTVPPTLTDLVVETLSNGTVGRLMITKVTERGNPAAQPSIGILNRTLVLNMPDVALALAHLSPDLSDPFVYVATADAGLTVVEINNVPAAGQQTAELVDTVALPSSRTATEVALGGDVAYVGTLQGTIEVFDLSDPRAPVHQTSVDVGGDRVTGISLAGFHMYISTLGGLAILNIFDPFAPVTPAGADEPLLVTGFQGFEVFVSSGHAYVAAGVNGVRDIDVTVPAAPVDRGDIVDQIAPGQNVNAADVIVSLVPVQTWLLVLETTGDLVGIKLDNTESTRERCLPVNNCGLDMDWRDPTVMGRDPSFIVASGTFDPADPSGAPFFRMQSANLQAGRRLARPALFERIGTNTGRRLRDSFMPGSGVLSLPVMQRMYSVQVCEDPETVNINGSGLGEIGYFFDGEECVAISRSGPGSSNRLVCEAGPEHGSCELPAPGDGEMSLADP